MRNQWLVLKWAVTRALAYCKAGLHSRFVLQGYIVIPKLTVSNRRSQADCYKFAACPSDQLWRDYALFDFSACVSEVVPPEVV